MDISWYVRKHSQLSMEHLQPPIAWATGRVGREGKPASVWTPVAAGRWYKNQDFHHRSYREVVQNHHEHETWQYILNLSEASL